MAKANPRDRALGDPPIPTGEDRKAERVVLLFLIDAHPERRLTIPEVALALNAGAADFAAEDAVERAIRELVGVGLLRCDAGAVLPTPAALRFWHLED